MILGKVTYVGGVQLLNHVQLFATPWTAACQASLYSSISWSLLKLLSIELVMVSNHLILCCPFSSCPQYFPTSRVFSNESTLLIRWPKYWSFRRSLSCPKTQLICKVGSSNIYLGEGNGNPLQYSCLENPRDGGAWWAAVCGVSQSWTQLN